MLSGMYVMLCLCVAFVYFQLDDSWKAVFSRAALLFFVVAFLTFMSIAAFPSFIEARRAGRARGGAGPRRTPPSRRSAGPCISCLACLGRRGRLVHVRVLERGAPYGHRFEGSSLPGRWVRPWRPTGY